MKNILRIPCLVGGAALVASTSGLAAAPAAEQETTARVVWQVGNQESGVGSRESGGRSQDSDTAAQPPSPVVSDAPPPMGSPYVPSPLQAREAAREGEASDRLRYQVRNMESMLVNAVQHAADRLTRQIRAVSPDIVMLTGTPRARGVVLDGYGPFFSVDVPAMSPSVNWSLRVLAQRHFGLESALSELRQMATALEDPKARADAERALQAIEIQVRPNRSRPMSTDAIVETQAVATSLVDRGADEASEPAPEQASRTGASTEASPPSPPAAAPGAAGVPSELLQNPSAAYEREVKNSLIDTVLDYAGSIPVGAEEWFTVAARDANYAMAPIGGEAVTIILRVSGADLAAFRSGRLSREDARQRVDVREF